MKINYNDWFYDQHKYLKGIREGKESFNDTKWIDMNKRYQSILNISSNLNNDQPFGVVGNNKGFDKLIDLMSKSNYTFEDINESLIDTYRMSLKNAMSRMVVNNHSVMFKCNNMDKEHVSSDKYTGYYIIDVPFYQLHFGDRDEFIRQKIHKMHNTDSGYYIPINEFVTSEISKILGFTILCSVNGFICNDCKVAVDDKGFKFKIKWGYSSDVEFIIYKLDEALVYSCEIDSSYIIQNRIPYKALNLKDDISRYDYKCLVNIFDKNFESTVPSVPNFGRFENSGFIIKNIQKRTLSNIQEYKSKKVNVVIYALKYLNEVPNVYPAVNYYDITDTRRVFTDNGETVKNVEGDAILSNRTDDVNNLEVCTPPITLDRKVNTSFNVITSCLSLYDKLMSYRNIFKNIGYTLQNNNITNNLFVQSIIRPVNMIYDKIERCYADYVQGAILTSLVPDVLVDRFNNVITALNKIKDLKDVKSVQLYTIDEFYGENYRSFVEEITKPFRDNALSNFNDIDRLSKNYFTDENYEMFNRPISEQCFITLRYHRDEECWLFDIPNIKHFKGIGNTFYIDDNLNGDEIFKFFVLYTDTESIKEKIIPELEMDEVLDFDLFCKEVDKHVGYIRYWYAENKLMKISKMLYNRYDGDIGVQVLSKILKRKINGEDIIDIYPSDINYEPSNITSDNINNWDDNSDRAPFAINFLFYTLSMLCGNEDKLESYFFHHLTSRKFNNRYSDIDIYDIIKTEKSYPINYSRISVIPEPVDLTNWDVISNRDKNVFYGLPFIVDNKGSIINNPYKYSFNVYETNNEYSSIYNDMEYIKCLESVKYFSYKNDAYVCKLMTYYLNYVYDYISELQTNYTKTFNQISLIDSGIETIKNHIDKINEFVKENNSFVHKDTLAIVNSVVNDNDVLIYMNKIKSLINVINICTHNNRKISVIEFFNNIISTLKNIYVTTGFDNYALKKTRMLYINLKKINTPMNAYRYKKWLNNIDEDVIKNLNNILADNENFDFNESVLEGYWNTFKNYRDNVITTIEELQSTINDLSITLQSEHIDPITEYCDDIINNHIKDLFIISNIDFNKNESFDSKPSLITMTISSEDNHIYHGSLDDVTLLFYPHTYTNNSKYYIKSVSKICEYAFFNGEDITNAEIHILDENGIDISTISANISFIKIGSNTDDAETFNQPYSIQNTRVDIQNVHESFDVNEDGMIINKKHADMNYEMLIGNHFIQLDHTTQKVLQPKTMVQGSIDRIYIPNQLINNMIDSEYSKHSSPKVYFKPSQVIHIPITDECITSVGGKYFVGQHLYAITNDKKIVFPIIVTAIDHSSNRGFIEAEIDRKNCKWFNLNDKELITKYLTTNIDCSILDDNIINFLDEFSNDNYNSFYVIPYDNELDPSDEVFKNAYSLPGDPIFVNNNAPFVYTRLNWFFNELIPDRFIDEEHKRCRFIYVGDTFVNIEKDPIKIKMVNHDFNEYTNPELYPILREEPNDHEIWDREIEVFNQQVYASEMKMSDLNRNIQFIINELNNSTTEADKQNILPKLDSAKRDLESEKEFQERIRSYSQQLESPTTWYNVRAYDDAIIYISNGRARISPSVIHNIKDIPFDDKIEVFIYDWEHKFWLDPKSYHIDKEIVNSVKFDEYDDYKTNNIIHSITIYPDEDFVPSKKLLIYLSYYSSNIFSDIEINDNLFKVRFKPLLSLPYNSCLSEPYKDIKIRKHFDGYESYTFKGYNPTKDFSIKESFHLIRPERSGKYNYSPSIRICNLEVTNGDNTFDFTDFDVYIKIPFKDISTPRKLKVLRYDVTINQPIENFVNNKRVKLICIQNNELSSYDGNISNIMFEGLTTYDETGSPIITITKSSLPNNIEGSFVCTIFKDDSYELFGGIITVNVTCDEDSLIDSMNSWIRIPESYYYKEIIDECIIVPKNPSSINTDNTTIISFKNFYEKESDDIIDQYNNSIYNPFEYYFDKKNKTRLPISHIQDNDFEKRLVIDEDNNPDIKLIKSTYIGICRYSLQTIPENGFIDLTGYLPTPLSRDRYEFWVNGRQILNTSDIVILSPTSIQLRNLKSLHNFELIELVESIDDTIFEQDIIYTDINGLSHTSYIDAFKSNQNILKQDIRFSYNKELHKPIQDYHEGILSNSNNRDIETNILDDLKIISPDNEDYNNFYNIPSINGIPIYHPSISSLGINDIPKNKILDMLDEVWKYEILTDPLFDNHSDTSSENQYMRLSIKRIDESDEESFIIQTKGNYDKSFTLYISKIPNAKIDDTENTLKIIPFIKTGTNVFINKQYEGMWLNSTVNDASILIN